MKTSVWIGVNVTSEKKPARTMRVCIGSSWAYRRGNDSKKPPPHPKEKKNIEGSGYFFAVWDRCNRKCTILKAEVLQQLPRREIKDTQRVESHSLFSNVFRLKKQRVWPYSSISGTRAKKKKKVQRLETSVWKPASERRVLFFLHITSCLMMVPCLSLMYFNVFAVS